MMVGILRFTSGQDCTRHRKPACYPARQHTRHPFPVHTVYVHIRGVCISSLPTSLEK